MNVGPLEIGIVLLIVLVIFGPKRLPQLGRSLGSGMREFKDSISGPGRRGDDDDDEHDGFGRRSLGPATTPESATVARVDEHERERVPEPRS